MIPRSARQRAASSCSPRSMPGMIGSFAARDPQGEGLVAILHPWESGRDNSVDWDEAFLARVPTDGVEPYRRRDTQHADAAQRPTQAQYDRYLWLVQHFRGLGWDNARLHDASPFRVVDPGFNAILIRSVRRSPRSAPKASASLLLAARNRGVGRTRHRGARWSLGATTRGDHISAATGSPGNASTASSIGGLLPAFAPIPRPPARGKLPLPSSARPRSPPTSWRRMTPPIRASNRAVTWRGPSWLVTNYMIAEGLLGGRTNGLRRGASSTGALRPSSNLASPNIMTRSMPRPAAVATSAGRQPWRWSSWRCRGPQPEELTDRRKIALHKAATVPLAPHKETCHSLWNRTAMLSISAVG